MASLAASVALGGAVVAAWRAGNAVPVWAGMALLAFTALVGAVQVVVHRGRRGFHRAP